MPVDLDGGSNSLILHNAIVVTADPAIPTASAVGLSAGRIRAVGDVEHVRDRMGRNVVELDAGGRTILPGLIDAHNHFLMTCESFEQIDARFPRVASLSELLAAIDSAAERTPPGQWIRGFGMSYGQYPEARPPTRWEIDAITQDHPVMVLHVSGHYAVVNSRAFIARGLTDNVADPAGGSFQRDAAGAPTGLLLDAAMNLVLPVALDIGCHGPNIHSVAPMDDLLRLLDNGGKRYLAAGLTTVCDPQVTRRELAVYRAAHQQGRLHLRTVCMPLSNHLDSLIEIGLAGPFGDDRLRIGGMKLYSDGTLIGGTAAFATPYGRNGEFHGTTYWQPQELADLVRRAHAAGWQVGIHTNGDRAMQMTLDAIEGAMRAAPRIDTRHRIEHCSYPTREQVQRIADLGIIPVHQPAFIFDEGDEFLPRLGERAHHLKPFRYELDAGVRPVITSDSYVATYRPLETIARALSRTTRSGNVLGAEHQLSLDEAIRAHTIDAATAIRMEDRIGSITPGKLADLTIVDGDLRQSTPDAIANMDIWMTILDGDIVHGAEHIA
ncbi:MAG: amidohydrolase [Chloroflexi bacterium]|nr:MAG: amidohydrolase [Chloroflexota bacterium]